MGKKCIVIEVYMVYNIRVENTGLLSHRRYDEGYNILLYYIYYT
jgi:hypothetical protein